jgi:molybdopterin-biosynthesis enzyme MoeA-like protein
MFTPDCSSLYLDVYMALQAVGAAYNAKLVIHDAALTRMRQFVPQMDINEARLRMVTLPEGCEVFWTEGIWVPTVCVGGKVFILPGVPRIYQMMLHALPETRVSSGGLQARTKAELETRLPEGDIAGVLLQVAERFPKVALGSYPIGDTEATRYTQLAVEADNESDVAAAMKYLAEKIVAVEDASVA